uniref:Uncharacterized protein n=1 Tax=Rhizophora mucronata TaxID=61149 RepID=A0A2P2N6X9_RHIMU
MDHIIDYDTCSHTCTLLCRNSKLNAKNKDDMVWIH